MPSFTISLAGPKVPARAGARVEGSVLWWNNEQEDLLGRKKSST